MLKLTILAMLAVVCFINAEPIPAADGAAIFPWSVFNMDPNNVYDMIKNAKGSDTGNYQAVAAKSESYSKVDPNGNVVKKNEVSILNNDNGRVREEKISA